MDCETRHYGALRSPPPVRSVAELAERQWGVLTLDQLRELGITTCAAQHWLQRGRLRPLHRGVYALGHAALRPEGRWLAAVLACGDGAVLSHRSAAALWGIRATAATRIDVTAPRSRRSRGGLQVHRTRALEPGDAPRRDGIPVTSVPRTLVDLAATLSLAELESATANAIRQRLTDAPTLEARLATAHGHRGATKLAAVLQSDPKLTRSELERRFLALVRGAGLPEPETNVPITLGAGEEWQLDALWRAERVSVELDSWRFHGARGAFESDRARAAALTVAGYRHVQFTWRQLMSEAPRVTRTLAALLAASR